MSRTAHPRPAKPAQDAAARVTSAAIGVADAYTRFQREMARLQRSIADARAEGLDDTDVLGAVRTAARGRADRAEAAVYVITRLEQDAVEFGDPGVWRWEWCKPREHAAAAA